jgi:hypothetical protein
MEEAHETEAVAGRSITNLWARPVRIRVEIESKLELGPCDHRSAKPWAVQDEMPTKRARTRRHHM